MYSHTQIVALTIDWSFMHYYYSGRCCVVVVVIFFVSIFIYVRLVLFLFLSPHSVFILSHWTHDMNISFPNTTKIPTHTCINHVLKSYNRIWLIHLALLHNQFQRMLRWRRSIDPHLHSILGFLRKKKQKQLFHFERYSNMAFQMQHSKCSISV